MLKRKSKLLGLLPGLGLGPQDLLHGGEDDQGQDQAGDREQLECGPGVLENLALADADADPQRMAFDLADRDQTRLAVRGIGVIEGRVDTGADVLRKLGIAKVLAEREAAGTAAARSDDTIAANQRDRRCRAKFDLIIELGEVVRVERG